MPSILRHTTPDLFLPFFMCFLMLHILADAPPSFLPNTLDQYLVFSDSAASLARVYQPPAPLHSFHAFRNLPVFRLTAPTGVGDILHALETGMEEYLNQPAHAATLLSRLEELVKDLLLLTASAREKPPASHPAPSLSDTDTLWLKTFERYVRQHLTETHLDIRTIARSFAMSGSTLLRQLKRLTGMTPVQYIIALRLDEAHCLLQKRRCRSVTQLAALVGYDNPRAFSRKFKKRFGRPPSDFIDS